jgi:hypothetical protein
LICISIAVLLAGAADTSAAACIAPSAQTAILPDNASMLRRLSTNSLPRALLLQI